MLVEQKWFPISHLESMIKLCVELKLFYGKDFIQSLCVVGNAGCGKSTIVQKVVNELQKSYKGKVIAYLKANLGSMTSLEFLCPVAGDNKQTFNLAVIKPLLDKINEKPDLLILQIDDMVQSCDPNILAIGKQLADSIIGMTRIECPLLTIFTVNPTSKDYVNNALDMTILTSSIVFPVESSIDGLDQVVTLQTLKEFIGEDFRKRISFEDSSEQIYEGFRCGRSWSGLNQALTYIFNNAIQYSNLIPILIRGLIGISEGKTLLHKLQDKMRASQIKWKTILFTDFEIKEIVEKLNFIQNRNFVECRTALEQMEKVDEIIKIVSKIKKGILASSIEGKEHLLDQFLSVVILSSESLRKRLTEGIGELPEVKEMYIDLENYIYRKFKKILSAR